MLLRIALSTDAGAFHFLREVEDSEQEGVKNRVYLLGRASYLEPLSFVLRVCVGTLVPTTEFEPLLCPRLSTRANIIRDSPTDVVRAAVLPSCAIRTAESLFLPAVNSSKDLSILSMFQARIVRLDLSATRTSKSNLVPENMVLYI
jgi:hypothetical protein